MSNTPLNEDDGQEAVIVAALISRGHFTIGQAGEFLAKYRKKHDLQARIDELESLARSVHENTGARGGASIRGFNTAVRYYGENIKSRIAELKQELEKL